MVDYQTISIVFTGLSISIAAFYYISTLRNAQRNQQQQLEARKLEMFMRLHQSKYDQKGLETIFTLMNQEWDNYEDYMRKYGGVTGHPEVAAALEAWLSYFDGIGLLVKEDMIDLDTVYDIAYSRILLLWFKFETIIKEFRKPPWGLPDYGQNLEYLANEMIKIRKQKGLPLSYTNQIHPTSTLYNEFNQ